MLNNGTIQDRRHKQALLGGISQALDLPRRQQPAALAMQAQGVEVEQVCF